MAVFQVERRSSLLLICKESDISYISYITHIKIRGMNRGFIYTHIKEPT